MSQMDTDQRESLPQSGGKSKAPIIIVIVIIVIILILLLLCCICGIPILSGIWNAMMGV